MLKKYVDYGKSQINTPVTQAPCDCGVCVSMTYCKTPRLIYPI